MEDTQQNIVMRVSIGSILVNIALSAFKLAAGVLGHSAAMVSDAAHSLSDVLSTFVVMIGVKLAGRQPDQDHPYGHERFECVAALLLAILLGLTGLGIGYGGLQSIWGGGASTLVAPGLLPLIAALVSIGVKEAMYWVTRRAAKHCRSGALMADAWHHRSDALSSVGSLIGIAGARLGLPALDAVACLVICGFILKTAYGIGRDALGKMTDKACDPATEAKMIAAIAEQPAVTGIDQLHTRQFGDRVYVEVEIRADGDTSLRLSHAIAEGVHDLVERQFPQVKHCMVHVNPE